VDRSIVAAGFLEKSIASSHAGSMGIRLHPIQPRYWLALLESELALEQLSGLRVAAGTRDILPMISPEYLERAKRATDADPWEWGFAILHPEEDLWIGNAGFKGAPDASGCVEIGYAVATEYQRKGHATDAANQLLEYAFADPRVTMVRAHTLPETNASTRVLAKCGFTKTDEIIDPEDGPIWRWERVKC
jgi:[ribosomal protein S5]-alanine N-acetyltransferase